MRIALLAPLPPEKNGIADYAGHFKAALEADGVEVLTPLAGCGAEPGAVNARVSSFDWSGVDLGHGELGGGRLREFHALELLRMRYPALPLTRPSTIPSAWYGVRRSCPASWPGRNAFRACCSRRRWC